MAQLDVADDYVFDSPSKHSSTSKAFGMINNNDNDSDSDNDNDNDDNDSDSDGSML